MNLRQIAQDLKSGTGLTLRVLTSPSPGLEVVPRAVSELAQQFPSARIEVRSGQSACALAACGAGVAIVDDLTARAWHSDKLGCCAISCGPTFEVFAVRHGNFPNSVLAKGLVAKVVTAFKALKPSSSG